jgi:Tol biopolymer transport system component
MHCTPRQTRCAAIGWLCVVSACAIARAAEPEPRQTLRIAFASNRDHYWYPHLFIYEHDGVSSGKIALSLPTQDKRLDHHPALSADGRYCAFGWEGEGGTGSVSVWDLAKNSAVDLPDLGKTPNAQFSPSLSGDGSLLAVTAWSRPGQNPRWDAVLFDVGRKQLLELPGLNTAETDERRVAISPDGNWLAFTTNATDGEGLTDIRLYDRRTRAVDELREMNSTSSDSFPALSRDGRYVCFVSDRNGGGMQVLLFDRAERRLVELPDLNSPGQEQSPSITADGRYIAFVSERFGAPGEHDIFLYDREAARLLVTPELNTGRDEYDPSVIVVPAVPTQ